MLSAILDKKLICILDFSNIVHENYNSKTAKIRNYYLVKSEIESHFPNAVIVPIADAKTRHVIDNLKKFESLMINENLHQAPRGEPADYYIIALAKKCKNSIIFTNDYFKEYNISKAIRRVLIPYKIIGDFVIFSEKLYKISNYNNF